ncbi:MAG: chloride channel protein [Spongiibacteraceae bacterium]
MLSHPDLFRMRRAINPKLWLDRTVIWLAAVVAGLCVVGYVWTTEAAIAWFTAMYRAAPWSGLLVTPLGGMLVVWLTRRFASGAAGSGIPQVMAALSTELPSEKRSMLVSLRLSAAKVLLGTGALAAGFSAGREGPSVQIAAGIMASFHGLLKRKISVKPRDLILAGGAAGIAAAFNTPLAGIVFAIEELGKRFEERSSGLLISAIVIAGLVAISLMGNLTYFGRIQTGTIPPSFFVPVFLMAIVTGIIGGFFSRLLVSSFAQREWRLNRFRGEYPILFAGACGLVVAIMGLLTGGATFGSGYEWSRELISGQGEVSVFYFAVKLAATWISFWSGIPGGIFAPALAVGAGIGHDVAMLLGAVPAPIIALGMAGFLAAVTQSPITAFIIVMEMIDGHTMVLSLMATALLASMISRLISAPLYYSLALLQLQRIDTPRL